MIMYEDKGTLIRVAKPITSASTAVSSVAGAIESYMKSIFPEKYFQRITKDTAELLSQQRESAQHNIEELYKVMFPNMHIKTRISMDNPVEGMEKFLHKSSSNLFLYNDLEKNYEYIFDNPDCGTKLFYTSDYTTNIFDINISVRNFMENVNLGYFLKSRLQFGYLFYMKDVKFEVEIPYSFMNSIARVNDLDLSNENDKEHFIRILKKYSNTKFEFIRKRNMASGFDVYYISYTRDLLMKIDGNNLPESVIRNEKDEGEYVTELSVQVSYWMPNMFILTNKLEKFKEGSINEETTEETYNGLVYNVPVNLKRQENLLVTTSQNHKIYTREIAWLNFIAESRDYNENIFFGDIVDKKFRRIIDYCVQTNIRLDDIVFTKLYASNSLIKRVLRYDADNNPLYQKDDIASSYNTSQVSHYTVNWDSMELSLSGSLLNETYCFGVYIDKEKYDIINDAIKNGDVKLNSELLGKISLTIYDDYLEEFNKNEYAIKKFNNNKELFATTPKYVFRAMTKFGPGYVELCECDENSENELRICIGYDIEEKPIIKSFKKNI